MLQTTAEIARRYTRESQATTSTALKEKAMKELEAIQERIIEAAKSGKSQLFITTAIPTFDIIVKELRTSGYRVYPLTSSCANVIWADSTTEKEGAVEA